MLKLEELTTSVSDVLKDWLDDQILDSVGDQTQTDMRLRSCMAPQRTSKAAKGSERGKKERNKI